MAARTIPLYVYLFPTWRTRRGFPFFVLARPSERRKSCRETPVLRRAATAICAGRPRRDAGKDTTDEHRNADERCVRRRAGESCRETGVSPTSCVLYRRTREGQNRGARLRFMQPLRDFCLRRAAARRRARQNGVQFEHLQYARRSSTGERPLAKGCHDDDTPCTEAATSHQGGTAWRCRFKSCRRAQTENIRRCDGRQELPERHGRVFVNSVGRDRFARSVRQSAGKGREEK